MNLIELGLVQVVDNGFILEVVAYFWAKTR
jgi:hypothetical protein